jgi:hypothetical protein
MSQPPAPAPSNFQRELTVLRDALSAQTVVPADLLLSVHTLLAQLDSQRAPVRMDGGAGIGGNVKVGGNFAGRDQFNLGLSAHEVGEIVTPLVQALARFAPTTTDPRLAEQAYLNRVWLDAVRTRTLERYVPLAGQLAVQAPDIAPRFEYIIIEGDGPEQRLRRERVDDIRTALIQHTQLIVLGEPGAGKSTLFKVLETEAALARLSDGSARFPFSVSLADHRDGATPLDFLSRKWRERLGTDGLAEAVRRGDVWILADALNQMPRDGYDERIAAWRRFAEDHMDIPIVFACRTRDYHGGLGVQQVEIEQLDDTRIESYTRKALPETLADALWQELHERHARLKELLRNPYLLSLLAATYAANQRVPANRGRLFDSFVRQLLAREQQRDHPDWIDAEAQSAALAQLAYRMQAVGHGTLLPITQLLAALPTQVTVHGLAYPTPPATLLSLGLSATLLDKSPDGDAVSFYHQLLQEYFAAVELRQRFMAGEECAALWHVAWLATEMPPPEGVGERNPMPPPPPTRWAETTILAAGLIPDAARFIEAVRQVNPELAARCLSDGGAVVPSEVRAGLQQQVLAALSDGRVQLRARMAAGHALGTLGDSRFAVSERDGVHYIEPPLVAVQGRTFTLGSAADDADAYPDERSAHPVRVGDFLIGQLPVTNAEFACFIKAGGY